MENENKNAAAAEAVASHVPDAAFDAALCAKAASLPIVGPTVRNALETLGALAGDAKILHDLRASIAGVRAKAESEGVAFTEGFAKAADRSIAALEKVYGLRRKTLDLLLESVGAYGMPPDEGAAEAKRLAGEVLDTGMQLAAAVEDMQSAFSEMQSEIALLMSGLEGRGDGDVQENP